MSDRPPRDKPTAHAGSHAPTLTNIETDPSKLPPALAQLMAGPWKTGAIPKWDRKTAERIVGQLDRLLLAS